MTQDFLNKNVSIDDAVIFFHHGRASLAWGSVVEVYTEKVRVKVDTNKRNSDEFRYVHTSDLIVTDNDLKFTSVSR